MSSPLASLTVARHHHRTPHRPRTALVIIVAMAVALALAIWLLWERLAPPLAVQVVAVAAGTPGTQGPPGDRVLARASGWFHPDPQPVAVSAQRAGSIATVAVRPGQEVAAGDILATLDPRDADLALRRAEAEVATAAAAHDRAAAEVAAATARLAKAKDRHERLRLAEAAVPASDLAQAGHEVAVRSAEVAVAGTVRAEAAAGHAAALVDRDAARLARERCTITVPVSGIVLHLSAAPGQHLSLENADTARLAELFVPSQVQVRADVALADAGRVQTGQRAEVECDLLPGRILAGRVTSVAGKADATRNTLQVHIAITAPPAGLRPDMLARVRILDDAPQQAPTTAPTTVVAQRLLAPSDGLRDDSGDQAVAWIVDADQRLRRRMVTLGGPARNGWTPVASGLHLGEPVVIGSDQDLQDGRRAVATFSARP